MKADEPEANELRDCTVCGGEIHYYEYTAWNGWESDVLDAWWSHVDHPADAHEAAPGDRR